MPPANGAEAHGQLAETLGRNEAHRFDPRGGASGRALRSLVLLVALVPREALKARIGEQIASWTGRDVSLRGEPEIGFFPPQR